MNHQKPPCLLKDATPYLLLNFIPLSYWKAVIHLANHHLLETSLRIEGHFGKCECIFYLRRQNKIVNPTPSINTRCLGILFLFLILFLPLLVQTGLWPFMQNVIISKFSPPSSYACINPSFLPLPSRPTLKGSKNSFRESQPASLILPFPFLFLSFYSAFVVHSC